MPNVTLKSKLLILMIVVAIVPIYLLGQYSDRLTQNMIRSDEIQDMQVDLKHRQIYIETEMMQFEKFADWMSMNSDLLALLQRSPEDVARMDSVKLNAIEALNEQFTFNAATEQVLALYVMGFNTLDLRRGPEAALEEPSDLYKTQWFQAFKSEGRVTYWGYLSPNSNPISTESYRLPFARTINGKESGKPLGYLVMQLKNDFFKDIYNDLSAEEQEQIYIADAEGHVISTNRLGLVNTNVSDTRIFKKVKEALLQGRTEQAIELEVGDEERLVVFEQSSFSGWIYVHEKSLKQLEEQKQILSNKLKTSIVLILVAVVVFSTLLSRYFTIPIDKLLQQIEEISQGNFNRKIHWHGHNEFDRLGSSVNRMSDAIDQLMLKQREDELEKRLLEMQMLQSQISPHFLYNTLNSIKSMAILQGSHGIEKMVSSLGRLLEASLGDIQETVTLKEELELLESYLYIQRIRYKGKVIFHKEVADLGLLDCQIIKFILQPIVENAIFHGLQAKSGEGEIRLQVSDIDGLLTINVKDDGLGIEPERLKRLQIMLSENANDHLDGFGIGIYNINRRIKLVYGNAYGIEITSVLGEYTSVKVVLPLELPSLDKGEPV